MNPQTKIIQSNRIDVAVTEIFVPIASVLFDDAPAVNIHGVNITLGATPFGPDESFIGRWYVYLLPPSVAEDLTVRNAWIANLNTIALANVALDNSQFIWGGGSIVCGEQSTFQHTFSPKTSRNAKKGSLLQVGIVADVISGVIDDWDGAATISCFAST